MLESISAAVGIAEEARVNAEHNPGIAAARNHAFASLSHSNKAMIAYSKMLRIKQDAEERVAARSGTVIMEPHTPINDAQKATLEFAELQKLEREVGRELARAEIERDNCLNLTTVEREGEEVMVLG